MPRGLYFFLLTGGVAVADQLTKYWVVQHIAYGTGVPVIEDFFTLVFYMNKGAAFGFLGSESIQWQKPFFIVLTGIISAVLVFLLVQDRGKQLAWSAGLSLVLGGALGNLIDRVRLGAVVDFLDFELAGYHWPAFNIADSAICTGVFILLISMYTTKQQVTGH